MMLCSGISYLVMLYLDFNAKTQPCTFPKGHLPTKGRGYGGWSPWGSSRDQDLRRAPFCRRDITSLPEASRVPWSASTLTILKDGLISASQSPTGTRTASLTSSSW